MMFDLTNVHHVRDLKDVLNYSLTGVKGEKTLAFLEEFCGFWLGGPASADELQSHVLQYDRGKRDVVLTLKTIMEWSPEQIVDYYTRLKKEQGD